MTEEQKNQIMMEIKVYEIERAKTAQEIKEILMDCEKVNEMIQAYEAIMGDMYCHNTVCVSKIEIALAMTEIIWNRRENEAFEKLSLTEKVERLSTLTSEDVRQKLRWCSMDELKEIARMLEVEPSSHEIGLTVRHDLEVRIYEKITHSKKLKKILSNAKSHENAQNPAMQIANTGTQAIHEEIDSEFLQVSNFA